MKKIFLYVLYFRDTQYIKIGISFNVKTLKSRISNHTKLHGQLLTEKSHIFYFKEVNEIERCEEALKSIFCGREMCPKLPGYTELTLKENYESIISFIETYFPNAQMKKGFIKEVAPPPRVVKSRSTKDKYLHCLLCFKNHNKFIVKDINSKTLEKTIDQLIGQYGSLNINKSQLFTFVDEAEGVRYQKAIKCIVPKYQELPHFLSHQRYNMIPEKYYGHIKRFIEDFFSHSTNENELLLSLIKIREKRIRAKLSAIRKDQRQGLIPF
ncbi:MAG: hypothetical protein GY909_15325 [Oligoflexia bacterium]|nr:hypothetical protein [Oligoflexia bacterium]